MSRTPRNKAKIDQNSMDRGIAKKCPACAELVKSEAKICRFCGNEFEATIN